MTRRVKRIPEELRREQIMEASFAVAARAGIGGLTVRAVATEARVSHALVLFHFGTKDRLVSELLEWLIAGMAVLRMTEDIARLPHARDRLHALLQQEMARMSDQPEHTRLFLEYWAMGVGNSPIRSRISGEMERYRKAFQAIMEKLVNSEPASFVGVTADGLAAVAASWIHGCAVQAMVDPEHFDVDGYLRAVRGMIARPK
ncbi:TetR/AcrR family transcriptional regulator [soil metagenome]